MDPAPHRESGPDPDELFLSSAIQLGFLSFADAEAALQRRRREAPVADAESPTLIQWAAAEKLLTPAQVARVESFALEGRADAASLIGRTLGGYEIVEPIGAGGMGEIYRAWDPTLEKHFAIKVLGRRSALKPDASDRFLREARLASRVDHPNAVSIIKFDQEDDLEYCVMALVEGRDLARLVRDRATPIPLAETLDLIAQAARGLAAIHEVGIVHRDVKPQNLLVDGKGRVQVTDFGLARAEDHDISLTSTGLVLGTPAFMSPEQGSGDEVDARSDIYSLGLTWFYLLTGKPAFSGQTAMSVLYRQINEPLPDPARFNPTARGPAIEYLGRMTAKKAADRPATMLEVVAALEALAEGATPARARPRWRRLDAAIAAAVVVAAAVLGAVGWRATGNRPDRPPPEAGDAPDDPVAGPSGPPPIAGAEAIERNLRSVVCPTARVTSVDGRRVAFEAIFDPADPDAVRCLSPEHDGYRFRPEEEGEGHLSFELRPGAAEDGSATGLLTVWAEQAEPVEAELRFAVAADGDGMAQVELHVLAGRSLYVAAAMSVDGGRARLEVLSIDADRGDIDVLAEADGWLPFDPAATYVLTARQEAPGRLAARLAAVDGPSIETAATLARPGEGSVRVLWTFARRFRVQSLRVAGPLSEVGLEELED